MTTQEMIFDYLKVQGLVPEYDEDKDIRFKYQMRNFVVSNYPDDRQFLQIMMPFIFDVTAENRVAALEACNKINLSKKIVKAVVMGEGVFLMTEVLLDEQYTGSLWTGSPGVLPDGSGSEADGHSHEDPVPVPLS